MQILITICLFPFIICFLTMSPIPFFNNPSKLRSPRVVHRHLLNFKTINLINFRWGIKFSSLILLPILVFLFYIMGHLKSLNNLISGSNIRFNKSVNSWKLLQWVEKSFHFIRLCSQNSIATTTKTFAWPNSLLDY